MRCKITLAGDGPLCDALVLLLGERDGQDVQRIGADWSDVSGSELVVLCDDVGDEVSRLAQRAPDAVVVIAADDEQRVCRTVLENTHFPRQRILGAAGVRQAARLRERVARALGTSPRDVTGLVVGGRGGTWVPVRSTLTYAGVSLTHLLGAEGVDALLAEPLPVDASPAATALAVRKLADAVVLDQHRLLPATAQCQGEYGLEDTITGVPVQVARVGIEAIVDVALSDAERDALA